MRLIAMVNPIADEMDFDAPDLPPIETVFEDVRDYSFENDFFTVIKNNGERHGVRSWRIESFKLVNELN